MVYIGYSYYVVSVPISYKKSLIPYNNLIMYILTLYSINLEIMIQFINIKIIYRFMKTPTYIWYILILAEN